MTTLYTIGSILEKSSQMKFGAFTGAVSETYHTLTRWAISSKSCAVFLSCHAAHSKIGLSISTGSKEVVMSDIFLVFVFEFLGLVQTG